METISLFDFDHKVHTCTDQDLININSMMTNERDANLKKFGKRVKIARIMIDGFEECILFSRLNEIKNYALIEIKEMVCTQSQDDKRLFISKDKLN